MALRLAVVPTVEDVDRFQGGLKIAVATSDRQHVDQHFGSTVCFAMYRMDAESHRFVEAVRFPPEDHDGNEDKLQERIDALKDCAAVYVQAVGSSAIRRLLAMGVQPLKVTPGQAISSTLDNLKTEISAGTTPWIARALHSGKDPSRFEAMSVEDWDE